MIRYAFEEIYQDRFHFLHNYIKLLVCKISISLSLINVIKFLDISKIELRDEIILNN